GPTASGKTALSLCLAERLRGEIVSCDSVAVYREFEIGTAKPSREERSRVPHHMIDIASPAQEITAGDYARRARESLQSIKRRGKLPIIVGGTGLYLRALLEGLFSGPPRSEELRARLRRKAEQRDYLHKILTRLDPETAKKIHPNDSPKLIRAIEVCLLAGERISGIWQRGRDPLTGFRILRIGLDPNRPDLYQRINQRCLQMFEQGLVEETRALLQRYRPPEPATNMEQDARPIAKAFSSLGYKQAVAFIEGKAGLPETIDAAQQGHRNYAKRQMTWFRREPEVRWLAGFGDDPRTQQQALTRIKDET
ncbi:MAG TPA: tRNA (adenosine(37)-N6)-dimethylallyltransferase MiaA, partial [Terriglobales bacterium]